MTIITSKDQTNFYNQYKTLSSTIVGNILRDIGTKEDVEECVDDIFVELINKYHDYNENKSSIKTYICILSRSRAINYRKKLLKNKTYLFDDDILLEHSNSTYIKDIIEKVILQLNYSEKQVFKYKFVYEYSNKQIASALNYSLGYTIIKVYRLKKKLIKLLKQHGIESWEV